MSRAQSLLVSVLLLVSCSWGVPAADWLMGPGHTAVITRRRIRAAFFDRTTGCPSPGRPALAGEAELRKLADLVRGYFDSGGLHVQISVLDTEELRAAKKHPEEYGDLIVRIGGYSEYFVALSEEMQDSVIERSAHAL